MDENNLAADLEHVLDHTHDLWEEVRGGRIFITGGTGFFGCWLLESFAWANNRLNLDASIQVLSRNPDRFRQNMPHLGNHPALQLIRGDVRTFPFPEGSFSHIILAATDSSQKSELEEPLSIFDTILEGTRHSLEYAAHCGARKVLFTSSGAVYGRQPAEMTHIPEEYEGAPDPFSPAAAYGEAKRASESLCGIYSRQYGFEAKVARCFAFVGPFLPFNAHFAIGNFIRDGLAGGPIIVKGDGSPFRSYLYAADLAIWLWTILFRGQSCRPYNVGSEEAVTIRTLAETVACAFEPPRSVSILGRSSPDKSVERYVPSTKRAGDELELQSFIGLSDAINRTIRWASAG